MKPNQTKTDAATILFFLDTLPHTLPDYEKGESEYEDAESRISHRGRLNHQKT